MLKRAPFLALLLVAACGGSPTRPSPTPSGPITLSGTITDTVSGATVGSFSQQVPSLPAFITVTADGFLTRQTSVSTATPTVDLIREAAPFDLTFYRQMVRGALDGPLQPIRRLTSSPSIYLQTAGLTPANVAALEAAARAVVPALTGGALSVAVWEIGEAARSPQAGWIVVDIVADDAQCGRSFIGLPAGHVWLNAVPRCAFNGYRIDPPLFAHELGHALGFSHVGTSGHLMHPRETFTERTSTEPSAIERHHAAIAYRRHVGNRDLDSD